MFKHILIPTDGSDLSNMAIAQGVKFAREINARVTGITVTMPFHFFALEATMLIDSMDLYTADTKAMATRNLKILKDTAQAAGVECATVHSVSEHPYEAIVKTAHDEGCDVIFMASHGRRGIQALIMGGETHKVLTHTKIPVLVFR
ncbi:MAG: universal stress protein [Pseudomonadota bacterium]